MKFLGLNKLSGEKRKQLLSVVFLTAIILGGLGFGLIKYQFGVLAGVKAKKVAATKRLQDMDDMVRRAPITEQELAVTSKQLADLEARMASRDVYSWTVTVLRNFKQNYKQVDIPQVGQPAVGEMNLLPSFPYRQATIKVAGTATYFDLGVFIADCENEFPHFRILNLEIVPSTLTGAGQKGLLSFSFDLVALVNPNPS